MELRENLELIEVEYENNGLKAILTFLDKERKEIRQVNWNRQSFKDGKFVNDPDKAARCDEWADQFFGVTFDKLPECVGVVKDVYIYDRFNSLYPVMQVKKFTEDMVGQIYQTNVKEITLDDYAIRIQYEIDGETYESKMTFGKYIETLKQWMVDPQKKVSVLAKFEEKYGVPIEKADTLFGHDLMVEVKTAFGSHYYGDIKKFPSKKGKK